jgi:hypothetical protein
LLKVVGLQGSLLPPRLEYEVEPGPRGGLEEGEAAAGDHTPFAAGAEDESESHTNAQRQVLEAEDVEAVDLPGGWRRSGLQGGIVIKDSAQAARASVRASVAPTQQWTPAPKATRSLGSQSSRNSSGSANAERSRFAAAKNRTTGSSRAILTPAI